MILFSRDLVRIRLLHGATRFLQHLLLAPKAHPAAIRHSFCYFGRHDPFPAGSIPIPVNSVLVTFGNQMDNLLLRHSVLFQDNFLLARFNSVIFTNIFTSNLMSSLLIHYLIDSASAREEDDSIGRLSYHSAGSLYTIPEKFGISCTELIYPSPEAKDIGQTIRPSEP